MFEMGFDSNGKILMNAAELVLDKAFTMEEMASPSMGNWEIDWSVSPEGTGACRFADSTCHKAIMDPMPDRLRSPAVS
jgi:hypothetical protein